MIWVDTIVQGVLLGGLYALFAAGLSLIFGVMRLVNIAQGDLIEKCIANFEGRMMHRDERRAGSGQRLIEPRQLFRAELAMMLAPGETVHRGVEHDDGDAAMAARMAKLVRHRGGIDTGPGDERLAKLRGAVVIACGHQNGHG